MTKMTCDLCGLDSPDPLFDVREHLQTEQVKQVCGTCEGRVNKALIEMRLVADKFVQATFQTFLQRMRGKFAGLLSKER